MTLGRVAVLVGIALSVMVVNVIISILYMVVYGHVIDPGHEEAYYQEHIKKAAPYCSIIAGIPLMFLAGWWVGGFWEIGLGVWSALIVWLTYAVIDLAIVSNFDAKTSLQVLLDEAAAQLGADATAVLRLDPRRQQLEVAAAHGFRSPLAHSALPLDDPFAGPVVRQQRAQSRTDLAAQPVAGPRAAMFAQEGFAAYYGLPLMAKAS